MQNAPEFESRDQLNPAAGTHNPAAAANDLLATTSYVGPYGEVVTTQRPPHRQFPQQAWGLQTVRAPPLLPWSASGLGRGGARLPPGRWARVGPFPPRGRRDEGSQKTGLRAPA